MADINPVIRPMKDEDLLDVLAWRNDATVRRCMLNQHVITVDETRDWFDRAQEDPNQKLLIVESGTSPLGFVRFTRLSPTIAEWGFYTVPGSPHGTGTLLATRALGYAFQQLGLHKVCAQVLDNNHRSIHLHEKLGFVHEGVLRDQQLIGDKYHDLLCFGLLHCEWNATLASSGMPER
jgi:UDP-4-amino-4,6-dideoxy-N-acetyl-beta-L-altrosamine N-acetyltransferase